MNPKLAFAHTLPRTLAALMLMFTSLPVAALMPPGAPGGPAPASAAGTLSINNVTLYEGDSGTTTFQFTVALSGPAPDGGVRFNIATANGTAVAGPDYVANILTDQIIPSGGTSYTFRVDARGDSTREPDETFYVHVTNVVGAGDTQAMGTILNDDSRLLSVSDVAAVEGNAGMTPFVFIVSLSEPAAASGVTFSIATSPGSASDGSDFTGKALTHEVIPAGGTSYSFAVDVRSDAITEADERFLVNVFNVVGATATDSQGMGTILNDDHRILSIADASRLEGDRGHGALTFGVTLSQPAPAEGVRFDIATSEGSAKAGSDYFHHAVTRQYIGPGATYYSFSVSIMGDLVQEPDETFMVTLSNVVGAVIRDGTATGRILDDDGGSGGGSGDPPTLSLASVSKAEGDSGSTPFSFGVSLSAPAPVGGVSFSIATVAGSATPGTDFVARSLTGQTIPAGASNTSFTVDVIGDALVEGDETFQVSVSSISGARAGATTATGTIRNDDTAAMPTLSLQNAEVMEGGTSDNMPMTFAVALSGPAPAGGVRFDIGTTDGTARAGSDYVGRMLSGQMIPAGATTYTFAVQVMGDTTPEPDETFSVSVSNVTGASIGATGTGTIKNDDDGAAAPTISVQNAEVTEGASDNVTMTFAVALSGPVPAGGVHFDIGTTDGTARAGSDYVGRMLSGQTIPTGATSYVFTVQVMDDATPEPDETFSVSVSNVTGASIGAAGTGIIKNDDTVTVTIADAAVHEGNSGTVALIFPIGLSHPAPAGGITISLATSDGSAMAGSDYVASALSSQVIPAGVDSFNFSIDVIGDAVPEPDETFAVSLTTVTGATIARGEATGTIRNDDTATIGGMNLTITADPVLLSWDHGEGRTGYYVIRVDLQEGTSQEFGPLGAGVTSWVEEQASPDVLTCYTVLAISAASVLESSDVLCAQTGVRTGAPVPGDVVLGLRQTSSAGLTWTGPDGAFSELVLGSVSFSAPKSPAMARLAGTVRRHSQEIGSMPTCYLVAGLNESDSDFGVTDALCAVPGLHSLAANSPTGWAEVMAGRLVRPSRQTAALSSVRATARQLLGRLQPYQGKPSNVTELAKQTIAHGASTTPKSPAAPTSKPQVPGAPATKPTSGSAPATKPTVIDAPTTKPNVPATGSESPQIDSPKPQPDNSASQRDGATVATSPSPAAEHDRSASGSAQVDG